MVWDLFDWHLHTNAGYYQMKEALQPIHVQYSIDNDGIQVVSTQSEVLKGARCTRRLSVLRASQNQRPTSRSMPPRMHGRSSSGPFGMRSEIGTATFTNFDSFKKFMPEDTWWPRNDMWNRHYFGPWANNAAPDHYFKDVNRRYGKSGGIEEFCVKAQLLNIETMKAMFEGWLDHSDKDAAGIIIWMSQSAYPSMVWQTYDYYFDLTGAYWGAKSACEPVHIYWNESDDRIRVANTSGKNVDGLVAEAFIYNLDGTQKFEKKSDAVSAPSHAVANCFTLTYPADLSPVHFLRLRLTDSAGKLVSENFYWRGTADLNFKALNSLKKIDLGLSSHLSQENGQGLMTATITNPADSRTVAFAIRPMLVKPSTGDQILPVYTSDGYFSLMPGESKQITFRFDPALAGSEATRSNHFGSP